MSELEEGQVGIDEVMFRAVQRGEVAGIVTLVTDEVETLNLASAGASDLAAGNRMQTDALFCIASMTKPITAAAVLMLQDEGKLSLDDPLTKYFPEFHRLKDKEGKVVAITLRQCLSHTSGMSDLSLEEEQQAKVLADLVPMILSKPTKFPPGEKWSYCQTGINMAAHVVEVVSGKEFPIFLEERIFKPLGMNDTTFYPNETQLARLAKNYARTKKGEWKEEGLNWITHGEVSSRERYPKANGGLFSTAADYSLFCRLLLNDGELNGQKILEAVLKRRNARFLAVRL